MTLYKTFALAALAAVMMTFGGVQPCAAVEGARHVVDASAIQARLDQKLSQADTDRQAIRSMLERPEVRQIAGAAGVDLARANGGLGVLSGASLQSMADQARLMNRDLTGGDGTIVLSATGVIIILLILILLVN